MHASQIQGCIVKQKVEMRKIWRITPFIACVPHSSAQYRYTIIYHIHSFVLHCWHDCNNKSDVSIWCTSSTGALSL